MLKNDFDVKIAMQKRVFCMSNDNIATNLAISKEKLRERMLDSARRQKRQDIPYEDIKLNLDFTDKDIDEALSFKSQNFTNTTTTNNLSYNVSKLIQIVESQSLRISECEKQIITLTKQKSRDNDFEQHTDFYNYPQTKNDNSFEYQKWRDM
jgi:hypothetical protein